LLIFILFSLSIFPGQTIDKSIFHKNENLYLKSDFVFEGVIKEKKAKWDNLNKNYSKLIKTYYEVEINKVYKGKHQKSITFFTFGGTIGTISQKFSGFKSLNTNDKYLIYLKKSNSGFIPVNGRKSFYLLNSPNNLKNYVIEKNDQNIDLFWPLVCLDFIPSDDSSFLIPVMNEAINNWMDPLQNRSSLFIQLTDSENIEVGYNSDGNNKNVISFETETWSWSSNTEAITILTYINEPGYVDDGKILDTDILINGVNFSYDVENGINIDKLRLIITHELGHCIGLEHTCNTVDDYISSDLFYCTDLDLPESSKNSIMYPYSSQGNYLPTEDDLNGVIFLFPFDDLRKCTLGEKPQDCSCSAGYNSKSNQPLLFLFLFLIFLKVRFSIKKYS
jgi:hypothetical protein